MSRTKKRKQKAAARAAAARAVDPGEVRVSQIEYADPRTNQMRRRYMDECPGDVLPGLTQRQRDAAVSLRELYYEAAMQPSIVPSYDGVSGGGQAEPEYSDAQLASRDRLSRIRRAVGRHWPMLQQVCATGAADLQEMLHSARMAESERVQAEVRLEAAKAVEERTRRAVEKYVAGAQAALDELADIFDPPRRGVARERC